jgi:hypothetical protein
MNSVEDQVRAATRAEASTLREVRPLRLPPAAAPGRAARARFAARWPRRWQGWLAPVAAAAVVIALAVSLVTIRDSPNGRWVPAVSQVPAQRGLPKYYVTLFQEPPPASAKHESDLDMMKAQLCEAQGKPNCPNAPPPVGLLIGNTLTGAKVSTVTPPNGSTFYGVTAAADDRTFVVDTDTKIGVADICMARTFYLLKLAPGTSSPTRLTKLAIPSEGCTAAMALSASGRELAVASFTSESKAEQLRIYSVATGQLLHSWSTDDAPAFDRGANIIDDENRGLYWVDGDQELTFPTIGQTVGTENETVRMLNLAAGGSDLISDSRVIWSMSSSSDENYPAGCEWDQDPLVSADGKTVVCVSVTAAPTRQSKTIPWRLSWLEYSTSNPKAAPRVLYSVTINASSSSDFQLSGLWINASGSAVIGYRSDGRVAVVAKPAFFGVISKGALRSLPLPPGILVGDATATAW